MDFDFSPEQRALYDGTLDFARKHLGEAPSGAFDRGGWDALAGQGLCGIVSPEEHGGLGLGALDSAVVMEALGRGCADTGLCFTLAAHLFACSVPLVRYGSEEQKARYLPRLASGQWIATHSITEPDAGSDVGGMRTTAVQSGDSWLLNGSKSYASNAPVADLFLVHAMSRPGAGYLGISAFLIERDTTGLSLSQPYDKLGLRSSPIGDIFLDDVSLDAGALLGAAGTGGSIFTHSMNWERACLFALYVGMMDRQLDEVVAHARRRKAFGKPIAKHQGVAFRVADMKLRLEAARLLLYRAAWRLDQGDVRGISADSAMAKLAVGEAAVQSGLDAIAIFGGLGIMEESGVARMLRDAVPATIFSGTAEMQRNVIARDLGVG